MPRKKQPKPQGDRHGQGALGKAASCTRCCSHKGDRRAAGPASLWFKPALLPEAPVIVPPNRKTKNFVNNQLT